MKDTEIQMAREGTTKKRGGNDRNAKIKGWKAKDQAVRRAEAEERQTRWAKLSPTEQLADLDRRLGKNVGAKRQRSRLKTLLSNPATTKKAA